MWKMLSSSSVRSRAMRSSRAYLGKCRMLPASPYRTESFMATIRFSATVRSLNRRMFWNVRAMPALFTCAVVMLWVSLPSSRMAPAVPYTLVRIKGRIPNFGMAALESHTGPNRNFTSPISRMAGMPEMMR